MTLSLCALVSGCKDRNQTAGGSGTSAIPAPTASAALPAANNATDKWLGKWIGPEGTYLVLSKNADKYVVLINSLDGPATYEGTPTRGGIEFQRNGKMESIHAGNGHKTGMKWLMDKTNCLIIKTGEGFCRD